MHIGREAGVPATLGTVRTSCVDVPRKVSASHEDQPFQVLLGSSSFQPTSAFKEVTMAGLVRMSLDSPEEVRPFEGGTGQLELVNVQGGGVGRATFLPGWRWSEHVKPIAQTDSCQAAHLGYFISGRMKVVMDDGEEMEYGPGDFAVMAPGHDAWVVGDEPCVVIDWQGYADYAKRPQV
jgi:quercetin dioxygenase-like cupin family protein